MKKTFVIVSVLILCKLGSLAQPNIKYIEILATVDALGNIYMMPLYEKNKSIDDTLFNNKQINQIISKSRNAITCVNLLSKEGWHLVSVISVSKDENGRPNTPFLAYYFKKE